MTSNRELFGEPPTWQQEQWDRERLAIRPRPRPTKKVMPFQVLMADPPWSFRDKLRMSTTKRGADANYETMKDEEIVALGASILGITAPDSCCALWVPSSKLDIGFEVLSAWGFRLKTIVVWVKGKMDVEFVNGSLAWADVQLAFGMGRYFRGACEPCLFGTRGRFPVTGSKSERNVIVSPKLPHSRKPEALQDSLERMYPGARQLELFARRSRAGWTCTGLECPDTLGEDVHQTIERLRGDIVRPAAVQ
jgi:N6-adenosine-specific RNA methylase IME4